MTPLYYQLKEQLTLSIKNGTFKPGSRIPAEPELREMYNVSRITVRRAVDELCKEGLLEKKRGKGTYVASPKIRRKIAHLMGFTEACATSGMTASGMLIRKDLVSRDEIDLEDDVLPDQKEWIYIQRIRYADKEPVMVENNYFPYPDYAFLMNEDLSGSLYGTLAKEHGILVTSSENSYIDLVVARGKTAGYLQVSGGTPLFYLHSEIYDQNENLIHIACQYISGDKYRFYLEK